MFQRDEQDIANLVNGLRHLPSETEWVEFKKNNSAPQRIGEYISALANGAALAGRTSAYVVWGVEDSSHEVVGTGFQPSAVKRGNEPLENWLLRSLNPQIGFRFHEARLDEKRVVVLEIEPASQMPVSFRGDEFIRVGSVTKKLKVCLIIDAGSAGVSPATPEGRIGYRQTIMSVRRKPAEARIYRGSQTT